MKKLILVMLCISAVTACSQPKDIYFNGSDGSHSGLKYDPNTKALSVNQ